MDVGERLWELREERGWSQKRTAKEAGLSHVTIANLETGKVEPRLPTLRKLARTFGMTVDELLVEGEPDAPLAPALQLEVMYVADTATRRRVLEAASAEERKRYADSIGRVIWSVLSSIPQWEGIADGESKPAGERRVAGEQRDSLWRHISRLVALRDEAVGEDEEPPQEELAQFIADHASVGAGA